MCGMLDRSSLPFSSTRALKMLSIAERLAFHPLLESGKELGGLLAVVKVS